jgi:hypothetical protein
LDLFEQVGEPPGEFANFRADRHALEIIAGPAIRRARFDLSTGGP